jgi:SAM-dependent methyltransferase
MAMGLTGRARWGVIVAAMLVAGLGALLAWRHATTAAEAVRLADALRLEPGHQVSDVGAGEGRLAFAMAERVGPDGRVYATEIDPERLAELRSAIARDGLENVSVIEGGETETGLEDGCCDAVYLRDVYHHLTDPAAIDASLHRAIRNGGRLVVIDFEPSWFLTRFFPVEHAPSNRGGHGVTPDAVIAELEAAGFALERRIDDWGFGTFALIFRRP